MKEIETVLLEKINLAEKVVPEIWKEAKKEAIISATMNLIPVLFWYPAYLAIMKMVATVSIYGMGNVPSGFEVIFVMISAFVGIVIIISCVTIPAAIYEFLTLKYQTMKNIAELLHG